MVRSRAAASRTMRPRVEWLFWSGAQEEGLVCGAASSPALMVRSRAAASRTMGLGRRVVTTPLLRRLPRLGPEHPCRRCEAAAGAVGDLDLVFPRQTEGAGDHVL